MHFETLASGCAPSLDTRRFVGLGTRHGVVGNPSYANVKKLLI
jgi:hypothetical protein